MSRHWTMREGFAIGAGLIAVGLMLQLAVGSLQWDYLAWPVNIIALGVLLALVVTARLYARRIYALRFLTTYSAAVPALAYTVILTIIMGLTPQTGDGGWLHSMLTFWPFALIYLYITFILGLITAKRLEHFPRHLSDIAFILNHAGLFIAIVAGTLGNADMQRLRMIATLNEPEWRAMDEKHHIVEMPIAVELKRFIMETYGDGSPCRFASEVIIHTKSGKTADATIDVNRPVRIAGWKLYQFGYDTVAGAESRISILELVRDPWLPAVYAGIFMMLAGATLMLFRKSA